MYESHWSLTSRPFDNRFDPRFYYPSESHQAALLKLHYAIEMKRSVAVLCGESGIGKTMLLEACLAQLPEAFTPVVRVTFPAMPAEQLIRYIARQLAPIDEADAMNCTSACIEAIERFLMHNLSDNRHTVILIDEAHLLDQHDALEPLRLLLNLVSEHSESESAMTICLAGNIPLIGQLARHSAFEDRVAVRCVLDRFSLDSTAAYINHRLRIAGGDAQAIYSNRAIEMIHRCTNGVPRRINRVCDLSLMIGYAQDQKQIDVGIIELAHSELFVTRVAA